MINDILLPVNGFILLYSAYLYATQVRYVARSVKVFEGLKTFTAIVMGILMVASGLGWTTTAEWTSVLRPAFTFYLLAGAALAFIFHGDRSPPRDQ